MKDRKHVAPTLKTEGDTTYEAHPSYGLVQLSRYTCTPPQNMFGSSTKQHSGISLTISTAEKQRTHCQEWHTDREELIEVNLTAAQFTDLITSFNIGGGVPCTINHVNARAAAKYPNIGVPDCPETDERQAVQEDFKATMTRIADSITSLVKSAKVMSEKTSVSKGDRREFVQIAESIQGQISSALPFVSSQFNEALDATLSSAKADLQSFTTQLAQAIGGEELQKQLEKASGTAHHGLQLSKGEPDATDV